MSLVDNIEISKDRGVLVVTFGEGFEQIDEENVGLAREAITTIAEQRPTRLVVNLEQTTFFGSSFIEVLFRAWNQIKDVKDGQFALSGLNVYCEEILQVTNLDRLWTIYPDREAAVTALAEE